MNAGSLPEAGTLALYVEVRDFLLRTRRRPSVSLLQRTFRLGYGLACELMSALEENGVVTRPDEQGDRTVIVGNSRPIQIINRWRAGAGKEKDGRDNQVKDVSGAVAILRSYSPAKIVFTTLNHWPCLQVSFEDVVTPRLLIEMGRAWGGHVGLTESTLLLVSV